MMSIHRFSSFLVEFQEKMKMQSASNPNLPDLNRLDYHTWSNAKVLSQAVTEVKTIVERRTEDFGLPYCR